MNLNTHCRVVITTGCLLLGLATARAQALTLAEAEQAALRADPKLEALHAERRAFEHDAIAAAQLPDPVLALGTTSLPVPEFDPRPEPMAQLQVGIEQRMPARSLRRARARAEQASAALVDVRIRLRSHEVRRSIRHLWATLARSLEQLEVAEARQALLERYQDAVRDGVDNGRLNQQDLLDARSRLIRVQAELARLRSGLAAARAELREWLPDVELPERFDATGLQALASGPIDTDALFRHPAVELARAGSERTEADVAVARAAFDPGWSWQLGLGRRVGTTPIGAPSETLLNARVTIDLPLFTGARQSARLAAARERLSAAEAGVTGVQRELLGQWRAMQAQQMEFSRLLTLYRDEIEPASRDAAQAARDRYRNGSVPLEAVLAAELEVLDVTGERVETERRLDQATIELAWLAAGMQGEPQ
ncbi:MAG: TolC family protein [Wenzhouxiangellaceae bacterium]